MSSHAQLDWLDGQPVSVAFGDVYFPAAVAWTKPDTFSSGTTS
jgi:hypothetical protein